MTGRNETPRLPDDAPPAGEAPIPERAGALTPVPPARARTWRLEMPAGQELLNANDRIHWSVRQRITRQLRSDAFVLAKYLKIPALQRAHVEAVYEPPDRRKRDAANLYPSIKACVDGAICDAGVLPDDDSAHLIGPDMRLGPPHPGGRVVLIITELPQQETPHA